MPSAPGPPPLSAHPPFWALPLWMHPTTSPPNLTHQLHSTFSRGRRTSPARTMGEGGTRTRLFAWGALVESYEVCDWVCTGCGVRLGVHTISVAHGAWYPLPTHTPHSHQYPGEALT